jgi:hypothetical protein
VRFFAEYLTGELTPSRFLVLHAALETDTLAARPVGAQLCVFAAHLACVWIFNGDKSQAAHWRSPFALSISLIVAFIVSPRTCCGIIGMAGPRGIEPRTQEFGVPAATLGHGGLKK